MGDPTFTPEWVCKTLEEVGADQAELGLYSVNEEGEPMSRSHVNQALQFRVFKAKTEERIKRGLHLLLLAKEQQRLTEYRRAKRRRGQVERMLNPS